MTSEAVGSQAAAGFCFFFLLLLFFLLSEAQLLSSVWLVEEGVGGGWRGSALRSLLGRKMKVWPSGFGAESGSSQSGFCILKFSSVCNKIRIRIFNKTGSVLQVLAVFDNF